MSPKASSVALLISGKLEKPHVTEAGLCCKGNLPVNDLQNIYE